MKRNYFLVVALTFIVSTVLSAGYDNLSEFDGREIVVRIYRKKSEGGITENKTVRIEDGTFHLSEKDMAGSFSIAVRGDLQTDPLLRQHISRNSPSYRPWEGPVFHLPVNRDELEGKPVTVRIYEDCINEPVAYKKEIFHAAKGIVRIDSAELSGSAFVAIFGSDQEDELIRKVMASRAYGWIYRQGMEYTLSLKVVPNKPQDYQWTFLDALGEPVADAMVEVYFEQDEKVVWVGSSRTDSAGVAVFDFCPGTAEIEVRLGDHTHGYSTSGIRFVVEHPHYGRSVIETHLSDRKPPQQTLLVPAVGAGSEADQRAFGGHLVDNEGKPISGLFVKAGSFRPLGGEWIGQASGQLCGALTDENGHWRIYPPPSEDSLKIGQLIPPKSECRILIRPPIQLGVMHYTGTVPNGEEVAITLDRPQRYARTFAFENESGAIANPVMLRRIDMKIRRGEKTEVRLRYNDWRTGGMFPLGTYEARYSSGGGDFVFEPIEVTDESPEELVFRTAAAKKVYYGRVVDGVTGRPMEGAFVINGSGSSGRNLSAVTAEEWDALHALPKEVSRTDKTHSKALGPVSYGVTRVVRTDSDGWFELTVSAKASFSKIVIFEKDYMTVITARSKCKAEDDNRFAVPLTRLFPAAKVTVETWAENSGHLTHPALWAEYIFDKTNNPAWIKDLLAAWELEGGNFMDDIRNDFIVHLNRKATFPIPAGLNMQLQLRPRYSDREEGWAPVVIAERINLAQGETLNLGRHEILRKITVFVFVFNSADQPVEGVPVNADDQYGRETSNTGEEGAAIFELAPDAKGRFVVEHKASEDSNNLDITEQIPYQITGPADANSIYTLNISDEILRRLFE